VCGIDSPLCSLRAGVKRFVADEGLEGYGWATDGGLQWPGKPVSPGGGWPPTPWGGRARGLWQ
jgi:hypothetical protein